MPFYYAESLIDGTIDVATTTMLAPGPTTPEYPETRFKYSILETDAGIGIRQRVKKQGMEYAWIWSNYGPAVPLYEDQYWELFALQCDIRADNGDNPHVFLKEDVTTNFGIYNSGTGLIEDDWIRVLVTYVGRVENKDGGNVRYDKTELRFLIADPSITELR